MANKGEPPSKKRKIDSAHEENEDEDEFEKFMKQINETASKQRQKAIKKQNDIASKPAPELMQLASRSRDKKEERVDLATETPMDAFIEQMQNSDTLFLPTRKGADTGADDYNSDEEVYDVAKYVNKLQRDQKEHRNRLRKPGAAGKTSASELKYDDYGNIITPDRERIMEELPPVDHSKIWYAPFQKDFYTPHADIAQMTAAQVTQLRTEHSIHCRGANIPHPIASFAYFGFEEKLMDIIIEQQFSTPTPIQMQAMPCLLSGRDVIGLAKTGSGKTAAFLWPLIPHILAQDAIEAGFDGPIALIVSPTRELAAQTYKECKRYLSAFEIECAPLYGGLNMFQQRQLLQRGVHVLVATPGRLIDLIKDASTNCRRVTFVVIDEVDKMFSLGFEPQLRSIIGQVRHDKQIAMFSATMNEKIESIIVDAMSANCARINVGDVKLSNADVSQYVEIVRDDAYKLAWLKARIQVFVRKGLVIIFCASKMKCEQLARDLNNMDVLTGCSHGDKLQSVRQEVIDKFKKKKYQVLVATDVAARGVNIIDIKTVINYDCPFNMDSYIHRVGRTGRGGDTTGAAHTLLVPRGENDQKMAPKLLQLLKKLRMLTCHRELEQMIAGAWKSKQEDGNDDDGVIYNEFQKPSKSRQKKMTHKASKKPLMSTFVKATESATNAEQNDCNTTASTQSVSFHDKEKSDAITHVFDKDAALPSRKHKRDKWGRT